ncbi:hypothetical protein FHS79_003281 [Polymorphobacter multimanifer]|uniref:DUF4198 domain-containing protein n=1 Tax=Polymorphobacter multimanifer TaxID=1070431 RepID=A0A841LIM9_9SPHN|nr:DUF4198 domain-containing protein [Polymorphobacter multimanifer]MBB6229082.1 hypothetical protein [Polymorphobacter multimanifer]
MKRPLFAVLLLGLASATQAHEVWIERDCAGPARIYLGEPAEALPAGGDPEFDKLTAPRLVPTVAGSLVRKAGFIEVAVPPGDVRVIDDNVFAPWSEDGKKAGIVYFARAGRSETRAAMPFEIVPVARDADRFTLQRDGKAVKNMTMTVISPDKWSKLVVADAEGVVTVPVREAGRYLISATQKEEAEAVLPGGAVSIVHRTATTSFVTAGAGKGMPACR